MNLFAEFLKNGILLKPDVVNLLKKENIKQIIEECKKRNIKVLDLETFKKLKGKFIKVEDVVKVLKERFLILKNFIAPKLDAISIKNFRKQKNFSVIGMVSSISNGNVVLEDDTGYLKAKANEVLLEGDVVGCKCEYDGMVKIKEIIFPDLNLLRPIPKLGKEVKISFGKETKSSKHYGAIEGIKKVRFKGFRIVLMDAKPIEKFKEKFGDYKTTIINLLKRRNLNPAYVLSNDWVLEVEPDILCIFGLNEKFSFNYKGTTIISPANESYMINLKTREVC